MNLFSEYQKKIFKSIKILEKKKIINIPNKLKNFSVELPPKNQKADISCNAVMILSKANNIPSIQLAEIIKKHLLSNFKEFKNIEIAGPGFLNIFFNIKFWNDQLIKIVNLTSSSSVLVASICQLYSEFLE